MNFPVPWRCLLPSEAVDFVCYNNHAILRDLSDQTGAMIDVSGDRDTPKRLSDRIVTMSGLAEQKEGACRGIVEKLRKLQDLQDAHEVGFFVVILPAAAVPVVVGVKGATIKEVLDTSGVELSIGKENVMGMPDTPIGLEGTADQVVSAVALIHRVVQDMADRGRLMPSDFKYRPDKAAEALSSGAGMGLPQVSLPPVGADALRGLDATNNFRTKAKIVVDTQTAGWLIGKGGRTIREMQENSGAFLHVLREDENPQVALRPGDRVIEICGRYERKLEGIQLVMRTADNMPQGTGPKETFVLIPTPLAQAAVLESVVEGTACVAEVVQLEEDCDETVICIAGSISGRIQVAQAFLSRIDQAHIDGTVVAKSVDGEVIGKDGRARKELRDDPAAFAASQRAHAPPPNTKPAPNRTPTAPAPRFGDVLQNEDPWANYTPTTALAKAPATPARAPADSGSISCAARSIDTPSTIRSAQPENRAPSAASKPMGNPMKPNDPWAGYTPSSSAAATQPGSEGTMQKAAVSPARTGDPRASYTPSSSVAATQPASQGTTQQTAVSPAKTDGPWARYTSSSSAAATQPANQDTVQQPTTVDPYHDPGAPKSTAGAGISSWRRGGDRLKAGRDSVSRTEMEMLDSAAWGPQLAQQAHSTTPEQTRLIHLRSPAQPQLDPHVQQIEEVQPSQLERPDEQPPQQQHQAEQEEPEIPRLERHAPPHGHMQPQPHSHQQPQQLQQQRQLQSQPQFQPQSEVQSQTEVLAHSQIHHEKCGELLPHTAGGEADVAAICAFLASNTCCGNMPSRLLLLLPAKVIHEHLIPGGHLSDIAQMCQVMIDLGSDVLGPGLGAETTCRCREVLLTGTLLSNSVAAHFLQERAARYVDAC